MMPPGSAIAPSGPGPVGAPVDPALLSALSRWVVTDADFGRRVFYSWTEPDQVVDLRKHKWLLTRFSSPARFATLDRRLRSTSGELTVALLGEALKYRRFAWIAPWATVRGYGATGQGAAYGDRLVRIELKPDAIIARIDSRKQRWHFVDTAGTVVDDGTVLAAPERVGAMYHVWHGGEETMGGPVEAYREYALCNESMIAAWEYATDATHAAIRADVETLAALIAHFDEHPAEPIEDTAAWSARVDREAWSAPPPADVMALYEASLAFPNDNHVPSVAALKQIQLTLTTALASNVGPIRHRPTAKFGDVPPLDKLKAKPRKFCLGTMISDDCIPR